MTDENADYLRELEQHNQFMDEQFKKYRKEASEWKKKWPAHCVHCNGWGGHVTYESHGLPGIGERLFEPCDCLLKEDIEDIVCPRCGLHGLTFNEYTEVDEDKECTECGWNYDDGLPEF